MADIYVSTDIETNGPIPGRYSMLSLGAAAFIPDGTMADTFTANLSTLTGSTEDPSTMAWWQTQPDVTWEAARKDHRAAGIVMNEYVRWVKQLQGKPTFVAYPVSFDWTFVYWYMIQFVGESPFFLSAIDIKSYAMAMLKKKSYRGSGKRNMPKHWFNDVPHTHIALDDAIEQGRLFCTMLAENLVE